MQAKKEPGSVSDKYLMYRSSFSDKNCAFHVATSKVHKIKYSLQLSDIKLAGTVGFALKLQMCLLIWIIGVKLDHQEPTEDKQDEGNVVS